MNSGYAALSAAILGLAAVAIVVAAFHDHPRTQPEEE